MPEGAEIQRPFWDARLAEAWRVAPIVWLSGVRRSGKTTIARALPGARFLNCDLPSVQRELEDPEAFYAGVHSAQVASAASAASRGAPRSAARSAARAASSTVVFDEIHRLRDPSAVLKIGADAFPSLRILATGSSTLAATRKFRDSLAGRKREVNLQPVLFEEPGQFLPFRRRFFAGQPLGRGPTEGPKYIKKSFRKVYLRLNIPRDHLFAVGDKDLLRLPPP